MTASKGYHTGVPRLVAGMLDGLYFMPLWVINQVIWEAEPQKAMRVVGSYVSCGLILLTYS